MGFEFNVSTHTTFLLPHKNSIISQKKHYFLISLLLKNVITKPQPLRGNSSFESLKQTQNYSI